MRTVRRHSDCWGFAARLAVLLLMVGSTTALLLACRFYWVQPEVVAQACLAGELSWRCAVREVVVAGFVHNAFGWTALLTGILATVARWRWLAVLAIVAGVAGAVLYTFELSGIGLLLGALVWIQQAPLPDADDDRKQQTECTPRQRAQVG